ncbi:helix-turn-helix domain-containing protein [Niallia sp. FSL W8-0951]|uniref:helix-turn-helix domain-containing protein n=1 Tax=Niallia TaxID=2837506 RepID=UPI00155FF458|nr:helix-turn-helix domain-containing protein [Niallia circulans]NRG32054.1 AraC family transcriptional regulator [Niallia circulans]
MKKMTTILKLLYQSTLIPSYIYKSNEKIHSFPEQESYILPPVEYTKKMMQSSKKISYLSTSFFAYYGVIKIKNMTDSSIIVGPVSQIHYSKDTLRTMKKEFVISEHNSMQFDDFFKAIPPMQLQQFLNHLVTIHFLINEEEIKYIDLIELGSENISIKTKQTKNIYEKKEISYFNNSYDVETRMLKYVELGNKEGLDQFIEQPFITHEGVMARDNLRQAKNTSIVTITLITRAAIRGGLDTEAAFQLSDLYIQQVEQLTSLESIQNLSQEVLYHFTKKVAEVKFSLTDNPDLKKITQYIMKNTNQMITVNNIAEHFGYSRTHLSSKFKKEMGIKLSSFITVCKLEEAKNLLLYTNKSISNISNYLCFSSQSHFQTVFKKNYGITPVSFRKKMRIELN